MKLASVGKRYGRGPWLFDRVTLDLEPGQVIAISGSNGSGKSTLLNLMAGLIRPTAGTISGRPRHIGYVPERFPGHQRMSAIAYLTHLGRIRGLSTSVAQRSTHALLERFSFSSGSDGSIRTLSKGNAQKVALAQALLVPPDLFILDEPWTGLDEIGHDVLSRTIAETAARGAIVALSRHLAVPGPAVESARYDLDGATPADGAPPIAAVNLETAAPTAKVVLRPHDHSRRLPGPWAGVARTGPNHSDTVDLTVAHHDCDRLLLAALQSGWSVVAVLPDDPPTEGRTDGSIDGGDDST